MAKKNNAIKRTDVDIVQRSRGHGGQSYKDRYPMPFFDPHTLWKVQHTGSYSSDYDLGYAYGLCFLHSCDQTAGWTVLLGWIVTGMVAAGPMGKAFPDGKPRSNGIVLGFMRAIGEVLACVLPDDRLLADREAVHRLRKENAFAWSYSHA